MGSQSLPSYHSRTNSTKLIIWFWKWNWKMASTLDLLILNLWIAFRPPSSVSKSSETNGTNWGTGSLHLRPGPQKITRVWKSSHWFVNIEYTNRHSPRTEKPSNQYHWMKYQILTTQHLPRKIPIFPKHPSRNCPPKDLKMQIDSYFTHESQNHQNSTFTRITKDLHV